MADQQYLLPEDTTYDEAGEFNAYIESIPDSEISPRYR